MATLCICEFFFYNLFVHSPLDFKENSFIKLPQLVLMGFNLA